MYAVMHTNHYYIKTHTDLHVYIYIKWVFACIGMFIVRLVYIYIYKHVLYNIVDNSYENDLKRKTTASEEKKANLMSHQRK